MQEFNHGVRAGRLVMALVALGTTFGIAGPVAAAPDRHPGGVRTCPSGSPGGDVHRARPPRIHPQGRVDAAGTLTGYTVYVGHGAPLVLGPGGFVDGPFGTDAIVGEREEDLTRLTIVDLWRGCARARLTVHGLVYGSRLDPATGDVHVSLVEPGTRRELGIWRVDPELPDRPRLEVAPPTGALATATPRTADIGWDRGPVGRWCTADRCETRRPSGSRTGIVAEPDSTTEAGTLPLVSPRPVPEEPAPRWPRDADLTYRWNATETPPAWIRPAMNAAADDVDQTSRSRTPTFRYDAGATDTIRYTTTMPSTSCSTAIACASYAVGASWTVRIRPQGSDLRWGTLRWCQADPTDGCFDLERVLLHELGHIVGIDHPQSAGFSLRPFDTVMDQLAPARPKPGSLLHAFGPCDVATLQERYGVSLPTSPISACNDLATTLALRASADVVARGTPVSLVAELRIPDRDAYGRLGGNALSGRTVQLWRRPLGSLASWTVFTMRAGDSPGTYLLSLQPSMSYEFQAVFAAPATEGLEGSTSPTVTIRVTGGCGIGACTNGTEDPMQ